MNIGIISSKNQITLPVRVLRKLNLKSGNKMFIDYDDGNILMKPVRMSIVDEAAGSLNKYISADKFNKSLEEIKKETGEKYTRYLAEKYNLKRK